MAYKLMVIDDAPDRRKVQYEKVLSGSEFDPVYVWSRQDFEKHCETPVDGYLLDIFLDNGDWDHTNAAVLLKNAIQFAPRPAPVFLISQLWGDDKVLDILKQTGESSAKIVQYLAWSEFEQAAPEDGTEKENAAAKSRMAALREKLLFELNHWHGRSGYRPDPNETIRILLLADTQYGDKATDEKSNLAENWIAKTLKEEARKLGGEPLPDLIVVAGDVTHTGRPDQFELAEERMTLDVMGPLWGENNIDRMRDRLVFVPGNHDVNLRFSASDNRFFNPKTQVFEPDLIPAWKPKDTPLPFGHQDYALEPFRRFAHRLTGDRNWLDTQSMTWVDRRFLHCGIRFFVLNSVAGLTAVCPDKASFDDDATRKITRSLADDESESLFSIAVSHHGLTPEAADPTKEKPVDNWSSVGRDFFSLHKISLWLYGHYHDFNARSLNGTPFDQNPLWLVQVPTLKILSKARGFCVLELQRSSGVVTDAYVHQYVLEDHKVEKKARRRIFGKG